MKIYIASDHGGFSLKEEVKKLDFEFEDLGPYALDNEDDYPMFADKVCRKVLEDSGSFGILICRSGIGMCITANKFKGIYAGLCSNVEEARKAREHNNANVLCLDADYEDFETHFEIVRAFISSQYAGAESRHERRVQQIKDIENEFFK